MLRVETPPPPKVPEDVRLLVVVGVVVVGIVARPANVPWLLVTVVLGRVVVVVVRLLRVATLRLFRAAPPKVPEANWVVRPLLTPRLVLAIRYDSRRVRPLSM